MFDDKKKKIIEYIEINKELLKRLFSNQSLYPQSKESEIISALDELHRLIASEYKKKANKDTLFLKISSLADAKGQPLFLNDSTKHFMYRNEQSERLNKEYKGRIEVYKYIPYIGIHFELKDQNKLRSFIDNKIRNHTIAICETPLLSEVRYLPNTLVEYAKSNSKYKEKLSSLISELPETIPRNRKSSANDLWNLINIGSDIANKKTKGKGSRIGIIDTGVDFNHPELEARFLQNKGYDFVTDSNFPMDLNGHGTHVAGIIAGNSVGVAPGCTLYALRVLDENGMGSSHNSIRALEWAIDHSLNAVNMSLGSRASSMPEEFACQAAYDNGVTICAAAGNEGYGPSYPAAYDKVIAVAAVDKNNDHAEFSNIWETNDISAPGVGIYSTYPGGYTNLSGTSMATPHITGVCALIHSVKNGIKPDELEVLIKKHAKKLGNKEENHNPEMYGAGLVRADKVVGE